MTVLVDIFTGSEIENGMYILKYNVNRNVYVMLKFTEYDKNMNSWGFYLAFVRKKAR